ncbi:hypothetical protein [Bacillus sp. S/N-304-OC-R1]|uniref:GNAT family N-acetyltransferase n=1 Tax=Bacillus sp. S/N-304-OC-R1 TaxID=2758034 RepID=UPI0028BDFB2E|nr:hypothetical protein [Bacillus sp. S/N-304-OC-R1]
MTAFIRCAAVDDVEKLRDFLDQAKLNSEGIESAIDYFLIMESNVGEIKATLGIEPLGTIGLLRSLVMTKDMSENDVFILFEQILMLAKDRGLQELYLSSNKKASVSFFQLLGFKEAKKESLPDELYESDHVKHILTVDNSFFLKLSL